MLSRFQSEQQRPFVSIRAQCASCISPGRTRLVLVRCGMAVAIVATVAAILLHLISFTNAGGLWRDEVSSANMATLPSLQTMWETLPHDSFPILFPAVTRVWSVTVGETDIRLRSLGLVIGLLFLASLWIAGWIIWRGPPLLSLTLFALNVMAIRYGDSVRAYGLAAACIVLTIAATWRFVETPTPSGGITAAVMATLSVQALYQNAVFVLAICVAGCLKHLLQRHLVPALKVLAIGVVPALSLTPYIRPILRAQDWWILSKYGFTLQLIGNNISSLTGHPLGVFTYVWALLVVAAVGLGIQRAISRTSTIDEENRQDPTLFATVALVLGLTGFGLFLVIAKLPTQPWYFFPAIGFAVVCCDAILSGTHWSVRIGVLIAAVTVVVLAFPAGLSELKFRQTDGDLLAWRLSELAGREDLIIVNPWYCDLTFSRYYRGTAPWTTLPGFEDYRYPRYDLFKLKMQLEHPAQPVLDRVAATLRSGHMVWVVGWLPAVRFGITRPQDLPPAPHGPSGWLDEPYSETWGAQLSYLIATHTQRIALVPDPINSRVNPLEDMQLIVATGWR